MAQVKGPERLANRTVVAPKARDECESHKGRNKNTLTSSKMIVRLVEKSSRWMDIDQENLTMQQLTSEPAIDGLVNCLELRKMMKVTFAQMAKKVHARNVQVTDKVLTGILNHSMVIILWRSSGAF